MVREVIDSAAMGKLRGIIQDRYGMGLSLKFIQSVGGTQETSDNYFSSGDRDAIPVGMDLHFPISVGDKFLATAVLEKGRKLDLNEIKTAGELIRLFLEPELFGQYLEQVRHNYQALEQSLQETDRSNNLVNLDLEPRFEDSFDTTNKSLSSNLFVFESKNPKMLFRLASNIHELSGRWAFLNIKDIKSGITSADELRSLGTITLVIDDLTQLGAEFQEMLADVLAASKPDEEPLFVIGTTTSLQTLLDERLLSPRLSQILEIYVMDADRLPKDPRLLQESLEIMMEI